MNTLKRVCLTLIHLAKQAWQLPQSIVNGFEQRRLEEVRNAQEVERLDRIRNPSKYLGKP